MDIINWMVEMHGALQLLLPLLVTYVLYFVFKKTSELSKHAGQNTAATLVVAFGNLIAATIFVDDLNMFAQASYNALGIPTLPADTWDNVPFFLVCVLAIVTKDFADYINHRLMHTKWGWPTHAAHHSDTHVNAFSGFRIHFLEALFMSLSYIVLLTWMQLPQAIPVVIVFYTFLSMYVHLDLDWDHGPFKYLLASPRFHRWHHADTPEAYGKNLANVMPLYDLMFGTYYNPGPCREPMGALKTGVEDKNPFLIFAYPFQEWARLIREAACSRATKARRASPQTTEKTAAPARQAADI